MVTYRYTDLFLERKYRRSKGEDENLWGKGHVEMMDEM
jgi:hypothetical protein